MVYTHQGSREAYSRVYHTHQGVREAYPPGCTGSIPTRVYGRLYHRVYLRLYHRVSYGCTTGCTYGCTSGCTREGITVNNRPPRPPIEEITVNNRPPRSPEKRGITVNNGLPGLPEPGNNVKRRPRAHREASALLRLFPFHCWSLLKSSSPAGFIPWFKAGFSLSFSF